MNGVQQAEKLPQTSVCPRASRRLAGITAPRMIFFISLEVILNQNTIGLRASWAAVCVRRLLPEERKFLDELHNNLPLPLHWVHSLPNQKDAKTALWALAPHPRGGRSLACSIMRGLREYGRY